MQALVQPLTWLLGIVFILIGAAGFFMDPLIVFEVDPVHNIIHILSGIVALALAGTYANARMYLMVFGAVYGLVAVLGFTVEGGNILNLIVVNTADNYLHAGIAVACLTVGLGSPKA